MDSLQGAFNKFAGGQSGQNNQQHQQQQPQQQEAGGTGGFLGGFGDKLNSAAGGGQQGEKNEDLLDKGVDFVQERFLGQGQQSNETATEQVKDEAISDFIRDKYKSTTGSDFPIEDKPTTFDRKAD